MDWLLHLSSNCCAVDDELIYTIYPKQSSHKLVIEGSDGTRATIDLFRCKIEVLAYMAGIEVN